MALKILLADDSMTAQNMGKKILVDAGYDVVAVSNGAAAIKKIASDRPDIIILDVYMPGYTGLEVCERVKGANETAQTPVLLTVGKMEPFRPEEANRVRADGVMIKPFEATDLIAAVQSIGQRLMSFAPKHVDTVRIAPPVPQLDQTMRISAPVAPHEDTVRTANSAKPFEDTIRLTAEQVRAFQDASYKDWVASAEVEDDHKKDDRKTVEVKSPTYDDEPEPEADLGVTSRKLGDLEPEGVPIEPFQTRVLETPPPPPPQSMLDPDPDPITPGLDATETPLARAMAGAMAGHEFFSTAPASENGNHEPISEESESPAMFAHEQDAPLLEPESPQPIFTLDQAAAEHMAPHQTDLEQADQAQTAEFRADQVQQAMVSHATMELESNAPLTPGPSFAAPLEELEPTVAAPINVVSEAAPELEVNSPHYGHDVHVATDPGLITNDGDLSQFVTKFGVEGAEEVHVGMASDLPPEQLAALTMPMESEAPAYEVPAYETQVAENVSAKVEEAVIVQEVPMLEPSEEPPVFLAPEPTHDYASMRASDPEPVVHQVRTSPLDEVGEIAQESSVVSSDAVVAYVPGLDDTEKLAPLVDAPVAAYQEPYQQSEPELETVSAMAASVPEETRPEEPAHSIQMMGAAAAAVAGSPAMAGFAHGLHHEQSRHEPSYEELAREEKHIESFASEIEESVATESATEATVDPPVEVLPEEPVHEPVGDAALAEELAAALSAKEAEDEASAAAANAVTVVGMQPVIRAAMEPMLNMGVPGLSDDRLSAAVARALERLKPQLINEIMKELTN